MAAEDRGRGRTRPEVMGGSPAWGSGALPRRGVSDAEEGVEGVVRGFQGVSLGGGPQSTPERGVRGPPESSSGSSPASGTASGGFSGTATAESAVNSSGRSFPGSSAGMSGEPNTELLTPVSRGVLGGVPGGGTRGAERPGGSPAAAPGPAAASLAAAAGPAAEVAVAGMAEALEAVRELIGWPVQWAEEGRALGVRWPRGLLLHGPPGCGKTLVVRSVAAEFGAVVHSVSASNIFRAYTGRNVMCLRRSVAMCGFD